MEILFFLLWKEWMVFVRYKRVERIKDPSGGGRTKGGESKGKAWRFDG